MKAARLEAYGRPLVLADVPVPEVRGDAVLIRVAGSGLCHSDLHILRGELPILPRLPMTLGHENAGFVEAVGEAVEGVRPGDAVAVFGGWGCGRCRFCLRGEEQLCNTLGWVGIGHDGGYAEYLYVPHARYLVPLGELDPVSAAPLTDAGLTPYRAVRRAADRLYPGSVGVVVGVGGLGQFGVQFMRLTTAARVVAVDVDAAKLERALALGADVAVDSREEDPVEVIRRLTDGEGAQAVVDFVGSAATLELAARAVGRQGRVVLVGLAGGSVP
ncbi:MAG: alcohol dehydrogenase catalytic domain-containing protein, partial [Clostridia bacterium]|nr:alcohol dehydrogenase catalytic domain-containing protein [Clostridia bacterium]